MNLTPSGDAVEPDIDWHDDSIASLRRDMLRFASLQLRNPAVAEDMVQDALLAAMNGAERFAGRAALKTWVFAILRNKIIDHFRSAAREVKLQDLVDEDQDGCDALDALFSASGHWRPEERPATWLDPDASLEQKQFWTIFDACINSLPERSARIFMMREFIGLETAEICAELGISNSNCWVMLHRARMGLRECLENRWFKGAIS